MTTYKSPYKEVGLHGRMVTNKNKRDKISTVPGLGKYYLKSHRKGYKANVCLWCEGRGFYNEAGRVPRMCNSCNGSGKHHKPRIDRNSKRV